MKVTESSFCVSGKSKLCSLCGCLAKITANRRLEVDNIIMAGKHSHVILFNEATVLGKTSYQWNMTGMRVVQ